MNRRGWWLLLIGLTPLLAGLDGCRGCKDEERVAELIAHKASVVRDTSDQVGQWRQVKKGDVFRIGDGLKTGKAAHARLKIVPDGEMLVQSDTLVRFQATAPGERSQGIQVQTGSVEIDSADGPLQIRTEVGLARIERGSRMQLKASANHSELKVLVGAVELDQQGKKVSVAAGHALSLDLGGVIIDKEPVKKPQVVQAEPQPAALPADGSAPPPEPVPEAETPLTVSDSSGGRAELTLASGESATIHDPNPPTRVRFPLAPCTAGAVVEVGRGGSGYRFAAVRGDKNAVVRLPAGSYRYRVRCSGSGNDRGRIVAKGSLVVMRDAGRRQLPKNAADISIDADGRSYTVRYQNLLPRLTFSWPDAPASKVYTINLVSVVGGAVREQRCTQSCYTFGSGKVPEGTYQFFFAIPQGKRSPTGKLSIAFDNSARTASLSEPADGSAPAGQKVTVGGTVLTRSLVSIGGTPITTDAQGRFITDVVAPTQEDAIAVRVQHSATKVHYYLRHLANR